MPNEGKFGELAAGTAQAAIGAVNRRTGMEQDGISTTFRKVTPSIITLNELTQTQIDPIVRAVPGGAANIQDAYSLTPLQEGMLFHYLLNPESDAYVVSSLLELESRSHADELAAALQKVVDRNDILRTAILWEDVPEPLQVVYRSAIMPVEELSFTCARDALAELHRRMTPQGQRWDLRQAPLIRLQIASTSSESICYALLQLHHSICDHESLKLVVAEAVAYIEGRGNQLPRPVPYRAHVIEACARAKTQDAETFFKAKLDVDEPTAPFGLLDVHGDGTRTLETHATIDPELARRVRAQARHFGVSAARVFHAAWALVVAQTSGRDDVVFGTVMSVGRDRGAAHRPTFGMFVNTLPLRIRLAGLSAKALLEHTHRELTQLRQYEYTSLAVAQRSSGVAAGSPLFTALFTYRYSVQDPDAVWSRLAGVRVLTSNQDRTNYPVTMTVDNTGEGFALTAQTDCRIAPSRINEYLENATRALIDALECAPDTPALKLSILPERERELTVETFNATRTIYPRDKLVHELFEAHVAQRPEAPAVTWESQTLSYAELNGRANRLARSLRKRGVVAGQYVPVVMHRSLGMVIAQLAVFKAGGVYVPVDPDLPRERKSFIIRDCQALVVLTDGTSVDDDQPCRLQRLDMTSDAHLIEVEPTDDLRGESTAPPPAYVMYTSGSTGVPKGVVVPHHAISRLVINNGYAEIVPGDCVVHHSNPSFDASTLEVWGALLNGARVLVVPQATLLDPNRFARLLEREHATVLYMSVGLFNQYADRLASVFRRLRYLMVGGDSLDPVTVRRVLRTSRPQYLLNVYGPTECTTLSTTYLIESVPEDATAIPIGRPLANTKIFILNQALQPVPVGAVGEIYIGGDGVAVGYLNRPRQTAERFITSPFDPKGVERLYRSGDLGRWRSDGVIEFLGRMDQQVKVRGYRIEPGEIEAGLMEHPLVREAAVIAREQASGDKQLVAYVVADVEEEATLVRTLKTYLRERLPEYMVPSSWVALKKLPLTPNGKLDRQSLPQPQFRASVLCEYIEPRTELERTVAETWRQILHLEAVGAQDDFFDLGGHSLLATRVVSRLREELHVELPIRALFEAPTVEKLARRIEAAEKSHAGIDHHRRERLANEIRQQISEMSDEAVAQELARLEGNRSGHRLAGEVD